MQGGTLYKKILCLTLSILLSVGLCSCTGANNKNPIVTIEMENGGIIKAELYPNIAPNTVANFVELIESGYYDGLMFHRVAADFVIQGGDPEGNGTGGPGYSIKGEFSENKFKNTLKHTRGVLSMARGDDYNSAGSQFFIYVNPETDIAKSSLDGKYAAFGKVMDDESMKIVDEIVKSPTPKSERQRGVPVSEIKNENGERIEITPLNLETPIKSQVIKQITVETFGKEYKASKITP